MEGSQIYEDKFTDKTYNLLAKHSDKPYLSGYFYFLGDLSRSSAYNYVAYIINFMEANGKEPKELTLDDYTKYLTSLRSSTASYQIVVYAALKKFSTYLAAMQVNLINPMQYIKRPKFKESIQTQQKRENGFLEEREIKKYIRTIESGVGSHRSKAYQEKMEERDMLIIKVFLNLGIRSAALFKMDISDVNLEEGTLITVDKGDKVMTHYLSNELINDFYKWYERREEILDGKQEEAVFISSRKERLAQRTIYQIVNKYAKDIKGKNITPHKLRATYGTQLYKKTGDLYFVQKCMNHSSPKTTEIYIRGQRNESKQRAVAIMSSITG